ncbi:DegV family protein [Enterococcus faecalis]|nr:DegV family protein [Enterococcus faecalis]
MVRLIAEQQEELEAYVLDTKNIGIGAGFSAIQAAKWLEDGVERNQLISNLNQISRKNKSFL